MAQRMSHLQCRRHRDLGSIPGLGRSPGEGNGNPLQYSCLENPLDKGAWWATVHGVSKSQTGLNDEYFDFHCLQAGLPVQGRWPQSLPRGWELGICLCFASQTNSGAKSFRGQGSCEVSSLPLTLTGLDRTSQSPRPTPCPPY